MDVYTFYYISIALFTLIFFFFCISEVCRYYILITLVYLSILFAAFLGCIGSIFGVYFLKYNFVFNLKTFIIINI